jgi:peptide/nickel transport system ATP-binding protein
MAEKDKLLRIKNLKLHFRTQAGAVQAVDDVNFELDTNQSVVVLGESGCGKTSLAEVIALLTSRHFEKASGVLANVPALRTKLPPLPGCSSTL